MIPACFVPAARPALHQALDHCSESELRREWVRCRLHHASQLITPGIDHAAGADGPCEMEEASNRQRAAPPGRAGPDRYSGGLTGPCAPVPAAGSKGKPVRIRRRAAAVIGQRPGPRRHCGSTRGKAARESRRAVSQKPACRVCRSVPRTQATGQAGTARAARAPAGPGRGTSPTARAGRKGRFPCLVVSRRAPVPPLPSSNSSS